MVTNSGRRLQKEIALVYKQINNLLAWISFDNAIAYFSFLFTKLIVHVNIVYREVIRITEYTRFFSLWKSAKIFNTCYAERTGRKDSPTPQVVHSNSSCPLHSEQVG